MISSKVEYFDLENIPPLDDHVPIEERRTKIGQHEVHVAPPEKWRHPEELPGEMFLGNFTKESLRHVTWESKRPGETAYSFTTRRPLNDGTFPVFVEREEIRQKNPRLLINLIG